MTAKRAVAPHTPGPWVIEAEKDGILVTAETPGLSVSVTIPGRRPSAEDKANALLIAAAPDLLKALQWLYACCLRDQLLPDSVSYMQDAEKAIAKALGK